MPADKNKFQRVSLKYRGAKLFNTLHQNNVVPQLCMMNKDIFNNLVHRLKDNYILGNTELTIYFSTIKLSDPVALLFTFYLQLHFNNHI